MTIHAYKTHYTKEEKNFVSTGAIGYPGITRRLFVVALCGYKVSHLALFNEDVEHSLQRGNFHQHTINPNAVSCKRCLKNEKFPLMALSDTEL